MNKLHSTFVKTLSVCFGVLFLFFYCTQITPSNPHDPVYPGDYRFTIVWDSIIQYPELEIFRSYKVPYRDEGDDKFVSFKVSNPEDSSILISTIDDTSVTFYFKQPFVGNLEFSGLKPNQQTVKKLCRTTSNVVNYFVFAIDNTILTTDTILVGISKTIPVHLVKNGGNPISPDLFKAIWELNYKRRDTVSWTQNPIETSPSLGLHTLAGAIMDNYDNVYPIDTVYINSPGIQPKINSAIINTSTPALGDTLKFTVKLEDSDKGRIKVFISAESSELISPTSLVEYSTFLTVPTNQPLKDTGIVTFTIKLVDTTGLYDISTISDTVVYVLPEPQFADTLVTVPIGDTTLLCASDPNQKPFSLYHWKSAKLQIDTTTTNPELPVYYEDYLTDTIILSGSQYSFLGSSDTLLVQARKLQYHLQEEHFPSIIAVGLQSNWIVRVVDSLGNPVTDQVSINWEVSDPNLYPVISPSQDTMSLWVTDSIAPFTISVSAIVNNTMPTNELKQLVHTKAYRPLLYFHQSAYFGMVNETLECEVHTHDANPQGKVDSIYWKLDDNPEISASSGTDTVWTHSFTAPGEYRLTAWAMDDQGFFSDTQQVQIYISSESPMILDLFYDAPIYVDKAENLSLDTVIASAGGKITKFFWDFNNDTAAWDKTTDIPHLEYSFSNIGEQIIIAKCLDEHGMYSQLFYDTVYIDPGFPIISSIVISNKDDTNDLFIEDTILFEVSVNDSNGLVKTVILDIDDYTYSDTIEAPDIKDTKFIHIFPRSSSGDHIIRITTVDDDKNYSSRDTIITIHLGKPQITGFTPSVDPIYINDENTYTIGSSDSNGTIDEYFVSWDNGLSYFSQSSPIFKEEFDSAGTKNIRVVIRDNDNVYSDTADYQLSVIPGTPIINSIWVDTSTASGLFINDTNTYHITATDPNETIEKIYISYYDGNTVDDSITWINQNSINRDFNHAYLLAESGSQTVTFWVVDNDGVASVKRSASLFVRIGTPVVWSDYDDTLWVVIDSGHGRVYPITVQSNDTNGIIMQHFWNESVADTNGADTTGKINTFSIRHFGKNDIHNSFPMWIAVKDDDGLFDSATMVIYADSIPPEPSVTDVPVGNQMKISWSGKDYKDGELTQYQILCDKNSPPTTVMSDFKAGKDYEDDPIEDYSFTFIPSLGSGTYYYQIISKDARGSNNQSDGKDQFNYFPK